MQSFYFPGGLSTSFDTMSSHLICQIFESDCIDDCDFNLKSDCGRFQTVTQYVYLCRESSRDDAADLLMFRTITISRYFEVRERPLICMCLSDVEDLLRFRIYESINVVAEMPFRC